MTWPEAFTVATIWITGAAVWIANTIINRHK